MPTHILWLDNDLPYIRPYVKALRDKGYEVNDVATLTEAEELLKEHKFDLAILDVMVPTQSEEEIENYPNNKTDFGHKTGVVFYKRMRNILKDKMPLVAVMTVRLDQDIRDEFVESGLNPKNFSTKYNVRDVSDFLQMIKSVLANSS